MQLCMPSNLLAISAHPKNSPSLSRIAQLWKSIPLSLWPYWSFELLGALQQPEIRFYNRQKQDKTLLPLLTNCSKSATQHFSRPKQKWRQRIWGNTLRHTPYLADKKPGWFWTRLSLTTGLEFYLIFSPSKKRRHFCTQIALMCGFLKLLTWKFYLAFARLLRRHNYAYIWAWNFDFS